MKKPQPLTYFGYWEVLKYLGFSVDDTWEWVSETFDGELVTIDEYCFVNGDYDANEKTKQFMAKVLEEFGEIKDLGEQRPIGGWTQVTLVR